MANVPQRRLEEDKRSKRASKKYDKEIGDFNKQELIGRRFYQMNPILENEQFANDLADEVSRLEFQRAKEGGYDSVLNPRKTGPGYFKKGGSVSPSKKTLAKSGFYDKGTTKSEREKIVNKVTTKPQRVKMVEKMLSTRKSKRYAEGGLAGLADSANSLMGEVDSMANTINYGSSNASSATEPLGFNAVSGFKKGGTVKSSASKRGDGIALRGKTRGKVV